MSVLHSQSDLVKNNASQFFIATHSPILLTFPNATIISFEAGQLQQVELADTSHFQITRNILNNPEQYWRYLSN